MADLAALVEQLGKLTVIEAADLVGWNGDICNRHRLAISWKGNNSVSVDRNVLCYGGKRADLSHRTLVLLKALVNVRGPANVRVQKGRC